MKAPSNVFSVRAGVLVQIGALVLLGTAGASAMAADAANQEMLERILAGVRSPSMRQLWLEADREGRLPALDKIPVPEQPFVKRGPNRMMAEALPLRRPVINAKTIIDVQPFSPTARNSYRGDFTVVTHDDGVIKGELDDEKEPFEILYKLPDGRELHRLKNDKAYRLLYNDEIEQSAQQRRIVLTEPEAETLVLASIAEGSQEPYETTIDNLDLTIKQGAQGTSPPVEVTYKGKSVTLRERQRKVIGTGANAVHAYLVTSYHEPVRPNSLTEGQPYYVRLILYR